MPYFAVRMENGPRYDGSRGRREQDAWDEHAAFMDELVDEGFLIIGGPVSETQTLHAIEADSEAAVRARLAADPWAPKEILRIASIEPWELWLDSRSKSASS
jgi:uncharacterized protein YciI